MSVPQNVITELTYDPRIRLLGIHPREMNTCTDTHTKTYTQIFLAVLFVVSKKQKQPKGPSTGEWINKRGICIQ